MEGSFALGYNSWFRRRATERKGQRLQRQGEVGGGVVLRMDITRVGGVSSGTVERERKPENRRCGSGTALSSRQAIPNPIEQG